MVSFYTSANARAPTREVVLVWFRSKTMSDLTELYLHTELM